MKNIFIAAVLSITAALSFAGEPTVGDYAIYDFTANGVQGTSRSELTSYDSSTGFFQKTVVTSFNGQTQTQVEQLERSDLSSTEQLGQLLAFCEHPSVGGTLEVSSTRAGNFDSCRLPIQTGGTVNMAVVPFGITFVNTADITMELIEYSFAK